MRSATGLNSYQDPPTGRPKRPVRNQKPSRKYEFNPRILEADEEIAVRKFGDKDVSYHATNLPTHFFNKESQAFWADRYKKEAESKARGEHKLINTSNEYVEPFFAQEWRTKFEKDMEQARGNYHLLGNVYESSYKKTLGGQGWNPNLHDDFNPKAKGKKPEIGVGEPPEIKAFLRQSYHDTEVQRVRYQGAAMRVNTWQYLLGSNVDNPAMSFAEEMAGLEKGSLHRNRKKKERLMLNSYVGLHKGGWVPASSIASGINGRYGKNFTELMGK